MIGSWKTSAVLLLVAIGVLGPLVDVVAAGLTIDFCAQTVGLAAKDGTVIVEFAKERR